MKQRAEPQAGDAGPLAGRTVLVAGASGTIGRAVVQECAHRGAKVIAIVRRAADLPELAEVRQIVCDATDRQGVFTALSGLGADSVISCLASRSGSPRDAEAVDYAANMVLLDAAIATGAEHFLLLSAICVQRPHLAFQHAKLRFEAKLEKAPIEHTIVRPTAFFKSLSGQIGRVVRGKPFLVFGDGEATRCTPISDADLASFIAECLIDQSARNRVLPIGGPGPAMSPREQGLMLFDLAGREPHFRSISPRLFDIAARILSLGAPVSGWFAEKAEYARIAKYYATQSMLVLDEETGEYSEEATPQYGSETLRDHYKRSMRAVRGDADARA